MLQCEYSFSGKNGANRKKGMVTVMTESQKKRLCELERELLPILEGAETTDDKLARVEAARHIDDDADDDITDFCIRNYAKLTELRGLYCKSAYTPDEDEVTLAYLFCENMSVRERLCALSDAHWQATSRGYADLMKKKLSSGGADTETELWEKNCENKPAINRLYEWLIDNE